MFKASGVSSSIPFLFPSESHSQCFVHRGLEVRTFFTSGRTRSTNAQGPPMTSNVRHYNASVTTQSHTSFFLHFKSSSGNKTSKVLRRYKDELVLIMRRRSSVSDFDYERETLLSDMEEVRHTQEKIQEEINKTRAEIGTLKLYLDRANNGDINQGCNHS